MQFFTKLFSIFAFFPLVQTFCDRVGIVISLYVVTRARIYSFILHSTTPLYGRKEERKKERKKTRSRPTLTASHHHLFYYTILYSICHPGAGGREGEREGGALAGEKTSGEGSLSRCIAFAFALRAYITNQTGLGPPPPPRSRFVPSSPPLRFFTFAFWKCTK